MAYRPELNNATDVEAALKSGIPIVRIVKCLCCDTPFRTTEDRTRLCPPCHIGAPRMSGGLVRCPACRGSGAGQDFTDTCFCCGGLGGFTPNPDFTETLTTGDGVVRPKCPWCRGRGCVYDPEQTENVYSLGRLSICGTCKGSGYLLTPAEMRGVPDKRLEEIRSRIRADAWLNNLLIDGSSPVETAQKLSSAGLISEWTAEMELLRLSLRFAAAKASRTTPPEETRSSAPKRETADRWIVLMEEDE